MSKYYLSWDCATKSLAYSLVKIQFDMNAALIDCAKKYAITPNGHKFEQIIDYILTTPTNENTLSLYLEVAQIMRGFITIVDTNVFDLVPDKKSDDISEVERITALKKTLNELNFNVPIDYVLIEHQPIKLCNTIKTATNIKSSTISHCLVYHYAEHNPILVDPRLKNSISFAPHLSFDTILNNQKEIRTSSSAAVYCARKKHSKQSLKYFAEKTNTNIKHVSPTYYDDIGDALLQVLGYIVKKS